MKVKLLVSLTGSRDGVEWPAAGGVVDLPVDEAEHMVAGGLAARLAPSAAEAAVAPVAPEVAAVNTKPATGRRVKAD